MKYLLALYGLFIFFSAIAQPRDKNLEYFRHINAAQQLLVEEDFKGALSFHKRAFRLNTSCYADDLFNGLKLADKLGDFRTAKFTAKALAAIEGIKGCDSLFAQFPILNRDSFYWKELLSVSGTKTIEHYRNEILDIHQFDQNERYEGKDLVVADSICFERFKVLYQQYGFPSEEKVGVLCSSNQKGFISTIYRTFFWHLAKRNYEGLDTMLSSARSGHEIHLATFAQLYDQIHPGTLYNVPVVILDGKLHQCKLSLSEEATINANRLKIGMPTIREQIKLIKYVLKHGTRGFRLPFATTESYLGLPPDYIEKNFIELNID